MTVAAVVVLLAATGVAVYERSHSGPSTGTALTSAVATTEQSKTADVALSMSLGAGGPSVTIAGNGDSDLAKNATNLTLAFSADGQPLTERAVIDGPTAYYNIGPLVGAIVPGKSWVSMDVGKRASSSSSFGSGGIFTDPSTLIAVIGAPGTALHALGPAVVNGSHVQQYSVHLGPAGIKKAIGSDTSPSTRALGDVYGPLQPTWTMSWASTARTMWRRSDYWAPYPLLGDTFSPAHRAPWT